MEFHTVKKAAKGQAMSTSINESNSWGADLHIPIHTNAGGGNGEINFEYMRSMYCDVMHRSDADFWTSNLKEIQERTNAYMEVKGLKEPVQQMQMYED